MNLTNEIVIEKYYYLCPIIVVIFSLWNLCANVTIIMGQR